MSTMYHNIIMIIIMYVHALIPWNTVDECAEGIDDCAQVCTDTDPGYTCSCRSGYRLATNGRGCDGKAIIY